MSKSVHDAEGVQRFGSWLLWLLPGLVSVASGLPKPVCHNQMAQLVYDLLDQTCVWFPICVLLC